MIKTKHFLFLLLMTFTLAANAKKKPNIILILVDDMGWKDFGEAGSTYYETPNIDKLSREGIRFTKGYSAAPVCSPSRGALLTGRYPARTKLTTVWDQNNRPVDKMAVLHKTAKPAEKNGRKNYNYRYEEALQYHCLPLTETTFADVLSENGYLTAFLGKWHCGWDESFWPDKRGFEYAEGFRKESVRSPHFGRDAKGVLAGFEDLKPDDYIGDKLTDRAIRYIQENAKGEKPIMLMLSFYLVHGPIEGKEAYIEKYKNKPSTDQDNPGYAAMVQSVDENVGKLVQAIKDAGIYENTCIIFTSDNGGLVPNTSCYPLLGGKSFLFEAGFRVPFIVVWKNKITPEIDSMHRIIQTDIFPTMLDIAGIPQKPELHKDGTSFYPLLIKKGTWSQKPLFFHYPHYTHATSPGTDLIVQNWKLIRFYNNLDGQQYMLFNLDKDPYELNDLASSYPLKVEEMAEMMQKYIKDTGCELPRQNPYYDPSKKEELEKVHYYEFAKKQRREEASKLGNL